MNKQRVTNYVAIVMLLQPLVSRELRAIVEKSIDSLKVTKKFHVTLLYAPLKHGVKYTDIVNFLQDKQLCHQPIHHIVPTTLYKTHYNTICLAVKEQALYKQVHYQLATKLSAFLDKEFVAAIVHREIKYNQLLNTSNIGINFNAHITLGVQDKDTCQLAELAGRLSHIQGRPIDYKYALCDATTLLTPIYYFT